MTDLRVDAAGLDERRAAIDVVQRLLGQGEPLLAYNAVQEGLARWPGDPRLRQLKALTLARSGDLEQASRLLEGLVLEGAGNAETLGILARTHKDLARVGGERRAQHLAQAYRIYREAYEAARSGGNRTGASYTGINAAAVAVLRGDLRNARQLAGAVREICRNAGPAEADYWLEATLGEAALILGDDAQARVSYARAADLARRRVGDLGATRRQALLLAENLPGDHGWIAQVLQLPPVAMFTGHMIDKPGRPVPRLPASLEDALRAAVRQQVERVGSVAAYGSAACGSDILYLEALRAAGVETHVVLPFAPEEFLRSSVNCGAGDWGPRFERALAAADSVTVASDHCARGSTAPYEYANLIVSGMARLRAKVLGSELVGLAIWDGQDAGGAGGAASLVRLWHSQGFAVDEMRLPSQSPATGVPDTLHAPGADGGAIPAGFTHEIRSLLFADAVGYSKLNEDQIPLFVTHFLGAAAQLLNGVRHPPEHVETTGDGLYMVFRATSDAAHYALQLNRLVTRTDWTACGLPADMNIRIALHCGPVYCGTNPLTGAPIYTGPHASRTARIEPITPPGQVYASSAFAAVAAALGVDDLSMNYIGRVVLAKGYGSLGLYHLAVS
jgi:hypothetical protein